MTKITEIKKTQIKTVLVLLVVVLVVVVVVIVVLSSVSSYREEDANRSGTLGSFSPSGVDLSYQNEFTGVSTPTPKTDTYADLTGNPFGDRGRTQTSQPIGTGGGGRGQRFGPTGGFYVGGVPTKPMKPQRLKKGGLAKPKVKPKRMKKGGLASKKK